MLSKSNNKPKPRKTRDWVVVMMLEHTKPGAMKDRKKKAAKDACRKWRRERKEERMYEE